MTQVLVKDQIKKLAELQKIDAEIFELKRQLQEKPGQLESLKAAFEEKKAQLKNLEEALKTKQLERKTKELDLQKKEEQIIKTNAQLSALKTNKEYKAMLTEIEGFKADKSIIEEAILLLFDEVDKVSAQMEQERSALGVHEKEYLSQKKNIEDAVQEINDKLKVLDAKRKQAMVGIDDKFLKRYERILHSKDGLAMVPVAHNSCTGCYINVPAQQVNEIKKHEDLVYCESCARILFLEEEL